MLSGLAERLKRRWPSFPWEAVAAFAVLVLWARHILAFFPNRNGLLGEDWQYVLPNLLDGYYSAVTEGFFHVPWFTPAFCGGLPKFPNPQDMYFTLPQLLTLFVGPLEAARMSVLIFGAAGFAGTWLLLRSVFGCGKGAAFFGAAVMLFNGFYSIGMIMGHATKHPFMLLPLCAFLLARVASERFSRAAASAALAAACFAYTVYAGGFALLLIMSLSILGIGLLAAMRGGGFRFWRFAAAFALSAALSLPLAAAKLAASSAFMGLFPRDFYSLPGVPHWADMPRFLFAALFGDSAALAQSGLFRSPRWQFNMHEFDFGITWIPLFFAVAGGAVWLLNIRKAAGRGGRTLAAALAFVAVLAVPLALNYSSPGMHAFLKFIPVIRNSSSNLRWLAAYIPLFAVLGALGLERLFKADAAKTVAGLAAAASVAVIVTQAGMEYYHGQPYDPRTVTGAYHTAKKSGAAPRIDGLAAFVSNGVAVGAMGRNDFLAAGKSSLVCYEPVFGYALEAFPFKTLNVGPVTDVADGALNIKNPACFVFPEENGCSPGDHFRADEKEKAMLFTAYRDFDFKMPARQHIAGFVSLVSWGIFLAVMGCGLVWWLTGHKEGGRSAAGGGGWRFWRGW